jgi:uncharacterized protein
MSDNSGKDFLGRGWKFPIQLDEQGHIALSDYEENVREAVQIILLTFAGERVMRPDFGSDLHDYVFSQMTATTIGAVQAAVRDALVKWEPRIQVLSVDVQPDQSDLARMLINLEYRVRATNTRFNQVFPFYLPEKT